MEGDGIPAIAFASAIRTIAERRSITTPYFSGMDSDRGWRRALAIPIAKAKCVARANHIAMTEVDFAQHNRLQDLSTGVHTCIGVAALFAQA